MRLTLFQQGTPPSETKTKSSDKMKTTITTAEAAANMSARHGKAQITAHLMLQEIGDIRHDQPELAEYLNHPEIVTGLAVGRFGRKGLVRRLTEMADADSVAA